MDGQTRREQILKMLEESEQPISGSTLAHQLGVSRQIIVGDVALLRAAAAKAGVSDISQKGSVLKLTLGVFHPQALVAVCGLTKYRQRLTLAAGETPALTLKLKPGEDVLEAARTLVEDLRLATEEAAPPAP